MRLRILLPAIALTTALVTSTGCATSSYYAQEAEREQRAADDLRRAGASEAAKAAQVRADANRKEASCDDLMDCLLDVLLSVRIDK